MQLIILRRKKNMVKMNIKLGMCPWSINNSATVTNQIFVQNWKYVYADAAKMEL